MLNSGENVKQSELFTHCWWECKMVTVTLENHGAFSYKWQYRIWKRTYIFTLLTQYCKSTISSVQFSRSVVSDSLRPHESQHTLPVHHQLPEFTKTHLHRVGDAIQPSHPLSAPSPPVPSPSQHQSLVQWVSSSHEVAKGLEFHL